MITNMLFKSVFIVVSLFGTLFLHAQKTGAITVKSVKMEHDWQEKITIEFGGLPQRETNSGRFDDVIIVPAGTADDKYGEGQRVKVSKANGLVEFVLPKAGNYEARIYLYEQPGIVAARSSTFRILSLEEGKLEKKSEEELVRIATRNKNSNKELMCRAVSEYFRRKPTPGEGYYPGMIALQSMCPKAPVNPIVKTTNTAYPITARYQCYRLSSSGDEVAEDIFILNRTHYKTMNKVGTYSYNAKTRHLTFTSGPLHLASDKWVGVYTGKGEPTGNGGTTLSAMIEIRRLSDIATGNKKVLQQCNCVR